MKSASSSVLKPVLTLAGLGVVLVVVGSVLGWDLGFARQKKGDVKGVGTQGSKFDSDGDGWVDVDDPLPFSRNDPDNDGIPNNKDLDDDGDLVVDVKDFAVDKKTGKKVDLSFDQNNNRKTDTEERHVNPNFDGNKNRRPDRREWIDAAISGAEEKGIEGSPSVTSLAQLRDLGYRFDNLPPGWQLITHVGGGGRPAGPHAGAAAYSVPDWPSGERRGGFLARLFRGAGAGSPYAKFHNFYGGKHTGQYVSTPQFTGGKVSGYVSVAHHGGGSGHVGKQSGGSWISGGGGDTGGVVTPQPVDGGGAVGGGGNVSGGFSGGHMSGGSGAYGGGGAPPPPPSGNGFGGH